MKKSYLPLGEGAAAAADEGRDAEPTWCRPTPVPGCARSTFPGGEGFLRRGYDTGRFFRRGLQDQPFQGFFQVFLVYAGIIDDQAVQVCGLGIKGAEGLDLQALGEECLGQGFVRQARIHFQ